MIKKKTTNDFIIESTKTHGMRYNYSKSEYINALTKIKIICKVHGEFEQIPRYHISGYNCHKCSNVYMDEEYFKEKSILIHKNNYDYSLVKYENNRKLVSIICPVHNIFHQKPKDHLLGKGCPKCGGKNLNTNDFIYKANKLHNNKYDYSKAEYINAITKTKIICPDHGIFEQTPNSHLSNKGCPLCNESSGERDISSTLSKNKIKFIPQYKFHNCKNIRLLPFDFYLPDLNICIEYHGEQHYKPITFFGGINKFNKRIINDNIKFDYCRINKINLIIINDKNDIIRTIGKLV